MSPALHFGDSVGDGVGGFRRLCDNLGKMKIFMSKIWTDFNRNSHHNSSLSMASATRTGCGSTVSIQRVSPSMRTPTFQAIGTGTT